MASPASAPSIESLSSQDQIAALVARIEKLEAIIELYISPIEEIFSDDAGVRTAARRAVAKKIERGTDALDQIPEIRDDLDELNSKLDVLAHKRKPGKLTKNRLKKTDRLLMDNGNRPISYSQMARLQEFKQKYRDQDMTKLGHVYEQYPDRYEIRGSKFGGKTIVLTRQYFKNLTEGSH